MKNLKLIVGFCGLIALKMITLLRNFSFLSWRKSSWTCMKVNIQHRGLQGDWWAVLIKSEKKKKLFQINKLQGTFWVQYLNKSESNWFHNLKLYHRPDQLDYWLVSDRKFIPSTFLLDIPHHKKSYGPQEIGDFSSPVLFIESSSERCLSIFLF